MYWAGKWDYKFNVIWRGKCIGLVNGTISLTSSGGRGKCIWLVSKTTKKM